MAGGVQASGGRKPRVCVVSLRGVNKHAAWCSNYEFEDVIVDVDDVDFYTLEPGGAHELRQWVARRLIWRPGLRELVPHVNPGCRQVVLERDYDLFVFVCMNPADLIYLGAITGWRERCARKLCFMVETYSGWVSEYAYHFSLLRDFDATALCFSSSVPAVQAAVGKPCHAVPLGVDVYRYGPTELTGLRPIDVYSMGRRVEAAHDVLLAKAARNELFYLYDTLPGLLIQPRDYRQHRDLIANCGRRSRFFVAYPAKVDVAEENRGQSEIGARFFEGAATGAVLIGQAPTVPAFTRDFSWPDAVVELGTTPEQIERVLAEFAGDPERHARASRRNVVAALRGFDWAYRWRTLLELMGMEPTPRLTARLQELTRRADRIEDRAAAR